MIASLRGLVALAAIAVVLAVAVSLHHGTEPVDRAVLPGFSGQAQVLRWERSVGQLRADHAGDRWMMGTRTLDARAIDAVLSALRGARWHRRAERARAGAIHATLFVDGRAVAIGQSLEGVDQAWLVVDGHALLVDGWVARALEPQALSLVDREPFAAAASSAIHISQPDVSLSGTPKRTAIGVVAPSRAAALVSALTAVQIVRLPTASASGTSVQLGTSPAIVVGGACAPDVPLLALHAASGDGCIEPAAWQAVSAAATALTTPDALDPRPAGFALDVAKPANADPDRVAELVAALAQPGELVALPPGSPRSSLVITPRGGEPITLDIYADAVARRGEPRAIRVAPSVLAVIARPASELADTTRWAEDPSVIARLVVDGATFDRGLVLGEWRRAPAGPVDAALLDALATAAARVRAPDAPLPASFHAAHHVAITFAPPVGPKITHELELAVPGSNGCAARIDRVPVVAPLALCLAVAAVAR